MGGQQRPFKSAMCAGCAGAVRRGGARCTRSQVGTGPSVQAPAGSSAGLTSLLVGKSGVELVCFPSSEVGQCPKGWDKGLDGTRHPGKVSIPWTGLSPLGQLCHLCKPGGLLMVVMTVRGNSSRGYVPDTGREEESMLWGSNPLSSWTA